MIVAVETNFVLELALLQEEAGECLQMLEFAERGAIQLAIPACALFEPYETLIRRKNERNRCSRELQLEGLQLARTQTHAGLSRMLATVTDSLLEVGPEQAASLARTIKQIVPVATVIPLNDTIIQRSPEMESRFGLDPQDAHVLASIDWFLASRPGVPAIFANRNTKDFNVEKLKPWLVERDCRLFRRFSHARAFVGAASCDQMPLA